MVHAAVCIAHYLHHYRQCAGNAIRGSETNFTFPAVRGISRGSSVKQHAGQLITYCLHKCSCSNVARPSARVCDANKSARSVICKHQFTNTIKNKNCITRHIEQAHQLIRELSLRHKRGAINCSSDITGKSAINNNWLSGHLDPCHFTCCLTYSKFNRKCFSTVAMLYPTSLTFGSFLRQCIDPWGSANTDGCTCKN